MVIIWQGAGFARAVAGGNVKGNDVESGELGAWSREQIRLNTELLKSRFTEPPSFFGLLVS